MNKILMVLLLILTLRIEVINCSKESSGGDKEVSEVFKKCLDTYHELNKKVDNCVGTIISYPVKESKSLWERINASISAPFNKLIKKDGLKKYCAKAEVRGLNRGDRGFGLDTLDELPRRGPDTVDELLKSSYNPKACIERLQHFNIPKNKNRIGTHILSNDGYPREEPNRATDFNLYKEKVHDDYTKIKNFSIDLEVTRGESKFFGLIRNYRTQLR